MTLDLDLVVANQTLVADEQLKTAVLLSLFTWARAKPDDKVQDATRLRGWWGDSYPDVPGDSFGSRLWLLWGRNMNEALAEAEALIRDALQWMIDDGLIVRVDVHLEAVARNMLGMQIGVARPDTNGVVTWFELWQMILG